MADNRKLMNNIWTRDHADILINNKIFYQTSSKKNFNYFDYCGGLLWVNKQKIYPNNRWLF